LVTDLQAWELVARLRLYLAAMAERYAAEPDPFTRPNPAAGGQAAEAL
jgi:hypothetical protein